MLLWIVSSVFTLALPVLAQTNSSFVELSSFVQVEYVHGGDSANPPSLNPPADQRLQPILSRLAEIEQSEQAVVDRVRTESHCELQVIVQIRKSPADLDSRWFGLSASARAWNPAPGMGEVAIPFEEAALGFTFSNSADEAALRLSALAPALEKLSQQIKQSGFQCGIVPPPSPSPSPSPYDRLPEMISKYKALRKKVASKLFFGLPEEDKIGFAIDMSGSIEAPEPVSGLKYLDVSISQLLITIRNLDPTQQFRVGVFGISHEPCSPLWHGGVEGAKKAEKFLKQARAVTADTEDPYSVLKKLKDVKEVFVLSDGVYSYRTELALELASQMGIPVSVKEMAKDSYGDTCSNELNYKVANRLGQSKCPYGFAFMRALAKVSGGSDLGSRFTLPPKQKEIDEMNDLKRQIIELEIERGIRQPGDNRIR